jgi:hypothetical protein
MDQKEDRIVDIGLIIIAILFSILCVFGEVILIAAAHCCPYGWLVFFPLALCLIFINVCLIILIRL